jgi:hypothetical protein
MCELAKNKKSKETIVVSLLFSNLIFRENVMLHPKLIALLFF